MENIMNSEIINQLQDEIRFHSNEIKRTSELLKGYLKNSETKRRAGSRSKLLDIAAELFISSRLSVSDRVEDDLTLHY